MTNKKRGFTLIEVLIVVAIIGILAALLIPNAITAIQKSKQKSVMKDIVSLATAATDYIGDNGEWQINQSGDMVPASAFVPSTSRSVLSMTIGVNLTRPTWVQTQLFEV
jgi:prepilin-type N-terminal cleavage/methylation domain-containing protein